MLVPSGNSLNVIKPAPAVNAVWSIWMTVVAEAGTAKVSKPVTAIEGYKVYLQSELNVHVAV